jgi:F-type H+-transporting ATPase subunit alpha
MKIDTSEISSVIKQEVQRFASELEVSQIGQVIEVGDGIARIYGLSRAMAGEMLEFDLGNGTWEVSLTQTVSGRVIVVELGGDIVVP